MRTGNSQGGGDNTIQRMVEEIKTTDRGLDCKVDAKRPKGNLKNSDGDHTTPFTVLQNQVQNCITGADDIAMAWQNLKVTLDLYKTLPGFATSTKQVRECKGEIGGYVYNCETMVTNKGDLNALLSAADAMIAMRNQMDLSAYKGTGGGGNAEQIWAGGLQDLERKFYLKSKNKIDLDQLKANCKADKINIMQNMLLAFDHGRIESLTPNNQQRIWEQHCRTIRDAYWQVSDAAGITYDELVTKQAAASEEWFKLYGN